MKQNLANKALKKLRKAKAEVKKAQKEFKTAKNELKAATFQAEVIKRKGYVEEIFWRFPHIGELIIDQLDNQSLTKTREVNKWWQNFVDNEKCFYIRKIQEHIYISNELVRKRLNKETVDNLKELESFAAMITSVANKQKNGKITAEKGRKEVLSTLVSTSDDPGDPVSDTSMLMAEVMLENIKGGCPLNEYGGSALHRAAENDNLPMFKLIAKNSENLIPRDNFGYTPLHNAARYGHYEMCKFIMENVQDLNPISRIRETPLHLAEKQGHKKICKLLKSANSKKENETPMNPRKKSKL